MTLAPDSERLHVVLLGERNSGKSSLLNAVAGQKVAIVSDVPGTTTDRVSKAIELPGLGVCSLIDTAGLDDCGALGEKRVEASCEAVRGADIALAVTDAATGRIPVLPPMTIPVIPVLNKSELLAAGEKEALKKELKTRFGREAVAVSTLQMKGLAELLEALREAVPEDWNARPLTVDVASEGDLVVLVMPQDSQAPKGRLILPQQQTIRELLERRCRIVCCTTAALESTLDSLKEAPAVIITDSQDFAEVHRLTPEGVRLTSFSILLAASKGDIDYFVSSARRIDALTAESRVLIAEACTHVPAGEDIGRVKIPALLRRKAGDGLKIDFVSGRDFPTDLSPYDFVIHCGACMFNRRYVMARVAQAKEQKVPMTNYGVAIAYINNLL